MTTATDRRKGRAEVPRNARLRIVQHLSGLSRTQRERLKQLVLLLERAQDEQERVEISKAVVEIVVPESIGGLGDLGTSARTEARKRVDAYRRKVGALIRRRREALSLTQQQLAESAGIPQSHVSRLERGRHAPTHVTMKKIARSLNTRPSLLDPGFNDEGDATDPPGA